MAISRIRNTIVFLKSLSKNEQERVWRPQKINGKGQKLTPEI